MSIQPGVSEQLIGAQVGAFKEFKQKSTFVLSTASPSESDVFIHKKIDDFMHKSYDELTKTIGLPTSKLEPILIGKSIELDEAERNIIFKQLADNTVLGAYQRKVNRDRDRDIQSLERAVKLDNTLKEIADNVNMTISGPIVTLRFKTSRAMDYMRASIGEGGESATGLFCPMPIGIKQNEDGRREIVTSPYVYLNFIDGESISQTGQNSEQHEEWHAIEMMRQVIYNTEMQQDPSLRVDSLQSTNKQKFEKRLHSFFLNPQDMARFFESDKGRIPELYDFFVGQTPNKEKLSDSINTASDEIPALIAGYIDKKSPNQGIGKLHEHRIINLIENAYLPFSMNRENILLNLCEKDEGQRFVIQPSRLQRLFNHTIDSPLFSTESWINLERKYTKNENEKTLFEHQLIDQTMCASDFQSIIDTYFNEGGRIYDQKNHITQNIKKSLEAFNQLVQLRGDSYWALFELSLLPPGQWETYVHYRTHKKL